MNFYVYGCTGKGNIRDHNEDAILVNHDVIQDGALEANISIPFLTAVCDGVGGEKAGEVASQLCLKYLAVSDFNSTTNINEMVLNIHNNIIKHGSANPDTVNMQTTLCCLAVDENNNSYCINVGDSRMYRYVNGVSHQISSDQTYGKFLYEQGEINSINELEPKMRSAIISSVGSIIQNPIIDVIPFVSDIGELEDDAIIICSDGVSGSISSEEMDIALSFDMPFKDKIQTLYELALKNGSTDNVSVIGIKPYKSDEEYLKYVFPPIVEEEPKEIEIAVEEKQLADESIEKLEKLIDNF
ncbi:MAG: PP2C family protein-serine/threonine phosphatase [Oscillospiraceae bacterium]